MIGSTISHYQILEKLGEGGMGVVYKALDTKLNRTVALKFLPERVSQSESDKARFLQEAQAAAGLNHPHICTVYGIEEQDRSMFIVMEYVDGGTIKDKLPFSHENETLTVAMQIGEALHEAHLKGIVHRDIKADNIMLTSKGQVKVMDFGLAKLKGSLKLTRTSSTVGTLAYMAPEQIQGGGIDARSDIFSFGILLFEMLTGVMPFRGEHDAAMMYSILNEQPEPLQKYLSNASPQLTNVTSKALEKNPEDRYQSFADLLVDLRRLKRDTGRVSAVGTGGVHEPEHARTSKAGIQIPRVQRSKGLMLGGALIVSVIAVALMVWYLLDTPTTEGKRTLAVLPFENQADPEKEYFADGITEEITTRLSGLSGLGVIARSSAREYKKTNKSLRQIGDELGVEYVLMGTVRWSASQAEGPRVRVSPELVKVATGLQVWSKTFEVPFSDAFTMQSDIASEVARALNVTLLQPETESLSGKLTDNAEAYDFYLRGIDYGSRGSDRGNLETGIQLFERAIGADPEFAAAFAQLAILHSDMYWFFYDRTDERIQKCKQAADRALELGPRLSEAFAAKGWYFYHCHLDYEDALEQFSLALKYQPNNSDVYYGVAAVRRRQGLMSEAAESFRKAVSGNPRAADMSRQLGETLTLLREYEEADRTYERTILLAPANDDAYVQKAKNLLLWKGDRVGAGHVLAEADRQIGLKRGDWVQDFEFDFRLLDGDVDAAERVLNRKIVQQGAINQQFRYAPVQLLRAQIANARHLPQRAQMYYDSARILLEREVKRLPDDERVRSALGIAYAGLGRKADAIREGQRAVELLPVEKEAWRGSYRLIDLAAIYVRVGEQEKAIDLLSRLLSIPAEISVPLIKIDPTWEPLHGNPRFEALLASHSDVTR